MKKFLLVLAIAFFAAELSFGQFALGVRLGYTASKLTTNVDSIKSDFNNGFHVGAWARFGKRFYIAPEFLYSMSGTVFTNEGNLSTNNWKQKIKIGSIDIPVLVGVKIIHSSLLTWRIEVGPEMSAAINKSVSDMNSVSGPITTDNIGDVIKNANWFILAGTGVDVLFLRLDIRYQMGLNEIIDVSNISSSTFTSKGNMLIVSLGFKIFGSK